MKSKSGNLRRKGCVKRKTNVTIFRPCNISDTFESRNKCISPFNSNNGILLIKVEAKLIFNEALATEQERSY